jgi:hypothetical protein
VVVTLTSGDVNGTIDGLLLVNGIDGLVLVGMAAFVFAVLVVLPPPQAVSNTTTTAKPPRRFTPDC